MSEEPTAAPPATEPAEPAEPGAPASHAPEHWEADVVLRDGRTMRVRPVRPEDAEPLQEMHRGQSESSVVFRFFAPRGEFTPQELHRFTHVDHRRRVALVLESDGAIHGIGRFDAEDDGEAEVAFYVSDAVHGLGLGSVLLEHLAAAAREVGVTTFTAEVLPHNGKMLAVFRDAGFRVRARTEDGVLYVRIDLEDTPAAWAVRAERERRAEAVSMARFVEPQTVLLLRCGDVRPQDAVALGRVRARLRSAPCAVGNTAGVDAAEAAEHKEVRGGPRVMEEASATLPADARCDCAVLAGPPEDVIAAVPEVARRGAHGVVVLSGGFAEESPTGAHHQRALLSATRAAGIRLLGPLSYGILAVDGAGGVLDLLAAPGARDAERGAPGPAQGVGLFAQSPESTHLLVERARGRGLPVASVIGAGNRADVSGNDTMQWWSVHEPTVVGVTYLESIGNPRKYARIARHLARTTPLVALVADTVARAALPGQGVRTSTRSARVVDQLLRQAGVLRTSSMTETLDLVSVLVSQPQPAGRRVAVVASSPGYAGLVSGLLATAGFDVVAAQSIDLATSADHLRRVLDSLPPADVVLVTLSEALGDISPEHSASVAQAAAQDDEGRTWIVVDGPRSGLTEHYRHAGTTVPVLGTSRAAVRVLVHLRERAQWLARDDAGLLEAPAGVDLPAARALVQRLIPGAGLGGVQLEDATTAQLLGHLGIRTLPLREVLDPDEAAAAARPVLTGFAEEDGPEGRSGHGVVLKLDDPVLASRSALGGLRVGLRTPEAVAAAWRDLDATRRAHGRDIRILLQAAAPPGVAAALRAGEDPLHGPVLGLGLSGEASDVLDDVSYRVAPLTPHDAATMVTDLAAAGRFTGQGGYPRGDLEGLVDLIARVAELVDELPEVREIVLDPVIVAPDAVTVTGARIVLAPAARQDTARRTLPDSAPDVSTDSFTDSGSPSDDDTMA